MRIGLALAALAARPALAASAVSFQEIEESLTCQCGCGLTVHSCNHLQCPSAIPLREEIRAQLAHGGDRRAILAYFAEKYGEKILSSPTTRGFNLTAWVTPFLAMALGGALVTLTLVRWRRAARPLPAPSAPPSGTPQHDAYERILTRELDRFES